MIHYVQWMELSAVPLDFFKKNRALHGFLSEHFLSGLIIPRGGTDNRSQLPAHRSP